MFGVGMAHLLLLPIFTSLLASLLIVGLQPSAAVSTIIVIVLFLAPGAVLSMFANTLYWRHVRKVIRNVPASFATQPDKRAARIQRNGGAAIGPMIGVMLGVSVFGGGMLAAISIPAYQDYTIRSQVAEGLNLASAPKALVEEIWISEHRWAEQSDFAGEIPTGKFVDKIEVFTGSVVITFGGQANARINGQRMAITPSTNADGDIRWACGNAMTPAGWTASDGYSGSDVPDKYLPSSCRSGS
jgi:type IV pilus assembly protein PilA